jgi:hypothetical protein
VDILDAIDAAVGCQECGCRLDGFPSDDFCSDGCQQAWHAARADELVGYREPWLRPQGFPGIRTSRYFDPQSWPTVDTRTLRNSPKPI